MPNQKPVLSTLPKECYITCSWCNCQATEKLHYPAGPTFLDPAFDDYACDTHKHYLREDEEKGE